MSSPLQVRVDGASPDDIVDRLVEDRVASRLAAKDVTLWGAEAEPEAAMRLSWVDLARTSRPLLAEIQALRAELVQEGLDRVVLCGMGGSSLAPELLTRTADVALVVLDSTDPDVVRRAVGADAERTVVVVSSKSGGTVETDSQRRAFEAAFRTADIDPATRMVVVSDPATPLADLASGAGYRRVFTADPNVGGRYSALSAFGLVPAGLAGVDLADLLDEAEDAMAALAVDEPGNPALVLAAALAGERSRDKLVIVDAGSGFAGFADWAEQLIAESTGKHGTGVLPVVVDGPDSPELRQPAADVTVARLGVEDRPEEIANVVVTGPLGAQLLLWEAATAVAGRLLGTNPFDQPDVESAKEAARGLLDTRPEPEPPVFVDGPVEVRGRADLLGGAEVLEDAVAALLAQLPDTGYVAVMAFLDKEADASLTAARDALSRRTSRPTTFGWGPRFLHSTGQYHKGGPAIGVYLQVTGAPSTDLEIPGRPFSFGELIAAQAAGDADVLSKLGRPVLRLHLTDRASGITRLLAALR